MLPCYKHIRNEYRLRGKLMQTTPIKPNLTLRRMLDRKSAEVHHAYIDLVIATGIVSIAGGLFGMESVSRPLFVIDQVSYFALWIFFLSLKGR